MIIAKAGWQSSRYWRLQQEIPMQCLQVLYVMDFVRSNWSKRWKLLWSCFSSSWGQCPLEDNELVRMKMIQTCLSMKSNWQQRCRRCVLTSPTLSRCLAWTNSCVIPSKVKQQTTTHTKLALYNTGQYLQHSSSNDLSPKAWFRCTVEKLLSKTEFQNFLPTWSL